MTSEFKAMLFQSRHDTHPDVILKKHYFPWYFLSDALSTDPQADFCGCYIIIPLFCIWSIDASLMDFRGTSTCGWTQSLKLKHACFLCQLRITEWFALEGTLKTTYFQSLCHGQAHLTRPACSKSHPAWS